MLSADRHHEDLSRVQADGAFTAPVVPEADVELAIEHEEELGGVVMDVPDVLTMGMRDPDVVVVNPADDPRAVDVAEGGRSFAKVDRLGGHAPIFALALALALAR